MTATVLIALITAFAAVIGSFVTWKISKRNASGAIDTSVAADLWAEGGKIRGELRTDLAETKEKLEETNTALREAVAAVSALNDDIRLSRKETEAALEESRLSRKEGHERATQITALTAQVAQLLRNQSGISQQATDLCNEVKTKNSLSLGGLADNTETRRILAIPPEDRTRHEQDHLDTATDRLPADLAAWQPGDEEGDPETP